MDKILKKYAWIGLLTFIPIIISGYYILYIFGDYWDALMRRGFSTDLNIRYNRDQELLLGGFLFLLIFFAYFTGISSSVLYILAHLKKKEKWLLWGHKARITTWIPVILCGLLLLGALSIVVIQET